jgi:hypothetical protein
MFDKSSYPWAARLQTLESSRRTRGWAMGSNPTEDLQVVRMLFAKEGAEG